MRLKKLLPKTLSYRFMLIFFFAAILPFLCISLMTISRVSDAMEEEAEKRIQQMLHLVGNNFDSRINALTIITERMYLYTTTVNGVSMDIEDVLRYAPNPTIPIKDYLNTVLDSNDFLHNILFIDQLNDRVYASGKPATKTLRHDWDYSELDFIQKALSDPRHLTVSSPHKEDYFFRSGSTVISFCRPLLSLDALPSREMVLGIMILDVSHSIFEETFSGYNWEQTGELLVVDGSNQIIYASDEARIGTQHTATEEKNVSIITESIPSAGWQVCYHLDRRLLLRDVQKLQHYILLLTGIALSVMVLATVLSSRHLSRPIERILKQMKRVRQGDMYARVPVDGDDELSRLSQGFNHMVEDLDTHIKRSYLASIQQKEAELDALKMQIHPHFLYNTLEVIRMSSVNHQDMETANMTLALVHQLQYVIGERYEYVPLRRELDMVTEYIDLVKVRYGQISLKINFPAQLARCRILKLSLQPIVENAVQHGLRPIGGGQLSIDIRRDRDQLLITIMDNGRGMDEQQLRALRSQITADELPQPKEDGLRSIGMKNVHDRIRLACGESYGLEIESQVGVGTAVVLCLPYAEGEEIYETADC